MHKKQKKMDLQKISFLTMKNLGHMPHSPTPTYTDSECQQQSVSYISSRRFSIGVINQGGLRHWTHMALSRGGLPDLISQK